MKNNRNHHQPNNGQRPCGTTQLPRIAMAQIDISAEEAFVKVPVDEFIGLVANNTLLDAVKRMIERNPYDRHAELRAVIGMPSAKEDKP